MSKEIFSGHTAGSGEPRRPLSAEFTNTVMAQTGHHVRTDASGLFALNRTTPFTRIRTMISLPTKHIAVLAGLATLVIGGTSFAAVAWLKPDVKLDTAQGITTLANGDKRFWVDYGSCQQQDQTGPSKQYYEMAANSKTSVNQLIDGLAVGCESDLLQQLFPIQSVPKGQTPSFKPYQDQFFYPYAQIESVQPGTLVLTTVLNGVTYHHVRVPVDQGAKFYEKGQAIAYQDLHAGSWLTLVAHTHSLSVPYSTETLSVSALANLSKDGLPIGASIKGAIQHVYNPSDANAIYQTMGKDWTRLTPDKSAPDGWKQVAPLPTNGAAQRK